MIRAAKFGFRPDSFPTTHARTHHPHPSLLTSHHPPHEQLAIYLPIHPDHRTRRPPRWTDLPEPNRHDSRPVKPHPLLHNPKTTPVLHRRPTRKIKLLCLSASQIDTTEHPYHPQARSQPVEGSPAKQATTSTTRSRMTAARQETQAGSTKPTFAERRVSFVRTENASTPTTDNGTTATTPPRWRTNTLGESVSSHPVRVPSLSPLFGVSASS